MGLAKFGGVIKFIPAPVVTGFTSGIAIIIFSSQIKDLFDLKMGAVPADLIEKWGEYGQHFSSFNWYALGLAALTILIIIYSPKVTTKLPGPFIALVLCTITGAAFKYSCRDDRLKIQSLRWRASFNEGTGYYICGDQGIISFDHYDVRSDLY